MKVFDRKVMRNESTGPRRISNGVVAFMLMVAVAIPASTCWGLATATRENSPQNENKKQQEEELVRIDGNEPNRNLLLVVGVGGDEKYERDFVEIANQWKEVARSNGFALATVGLADREPTRVTEVKEQTKATDREQLFAELAARVDSSKPLWMVFVGHGTFDGVAAKFNLRGRDVSASELKRRLAERTHRTVIVNCASASAPFVNRLSAPNRVIVTATQSGSQYNATAFGRMFVNAFGKGADLDKDGQVSLLEVFISASAATREYYDSQNRIATEKAILDDNGDRLGTPADWFSGVRCVKKPKNAEVADGVLANQVFPVFNRDAITLGEAESKVRADLESQLEALVEKRATMDEEEFLRQVEPVLLKLASLYVEKGEDDVP